MDSVEEFEPVAKVFDELGIDYQVGGSVASSVHGMPRGTQDIDVEADIRAEHIEPLVEKLKARFVIFPEMIRDALRYQRAFNLLPYDSISKIDVFVRKNRAFDQQAAGRRLKDVQMDDGSVFPYYVDSVEDTVLRKLEWYRMGGEISDQKWKDVQTVLKAQVFDLDLDYLEHWAVELNVADLLARALDESGVKQQ